MCRAPNAGKDDCRSSRDLSEQGLFAFFVGCEVRVAGKLALRQAEKALHRCIFRAVAFAGACTLLSSVADPDRKKL